MEVKVVELLGQAYVLLGKADNLTNLGFTSDDIQSAMSTVRKATMAAVIGECP